MYIYVVGPDSLTSPCSKVSVKLVIFTPHTGIATGREPRKARPLAGGEKEERGVANRCGNRFETVDVEINDGNGKVMPASH